MTLDEIREEIEKTQHLVSALFSEFKDKTGLCIVGCEISTLTCNSICRERPRDVFISKVSLAVERL